MRARPTGEITDAKILDSLVRFSNTANYVEAIRILMWLFDHEYEVEHALLSDLAEDLPCGAGFDGLFFAESETELELKRYSVLKSLCERL